MVKAVVYDLDDLMVNSYPLHSIASDEVLKKYGVDLKEVNDMRANFVGMRISDILKMIVDRFDLKVSMGKLRKERSAIFLKLVREKLKSMPGLLNSLELIKKKDFKIAIASSGTREYINTVIAKFKISSYFDLIVSGDDVKKGKPDPETYIVTSKKMGLDPGEIVVLEDATNGIAAAKSAGCWCIAIKNPYTPYQDLSKADLFIDSLGNLSLKIINSFN